jgi:hypothetical protein
MKRMTAFIIAAAALAAATEASLAGASGDGSVRGAIVGDMANERPAYLPAPDPGYIAYPKYAAALPAPTCYWTRIPVYDSQGNVIGWRGRPVAVCP